MWKGNKNGLKGKRDTKAVSVARDISEKITMGKFFMKDNRSRFLFVVWVGFLAFVSMFGVATATNVEYPLLRQELFGENQLDTISSHPYGDGKYVESATPDGLVYICSLEKEVDFSEKDSTENRANSGSFGVAFTLQVGQERPEPIYMAAQSLAKDVTGSMDSGYAIYADLIYADDTPEWGVSVPFHIGTHEWEKVEKTFIPEKPIKSMTFYLLFRGHTGYVEFARPEVRFLKPMESKPIFFDGTPILYEPNRDSEKSTNIYVRDVMEDSDWISVNDVTKVEENSSVFSDPILGSASGFEIELTGDPRLSKEFDALSSEKMKDGTAILPRVQLKIHNTQKRDRAATVVVAWTIPRMERIDWLASPDQVETIHWNDREKDTKEYTLTKSTAAGTGRLGQWPMAGIRYTPGPDFGGEIRRIMGVSQPTCIEHWFVMDPDFPSVSRIFYNSATSELCIAFDLGFTQECSDVDLRFSYRYVAYYGGKTPIEWSYREQWRNSPFYVDVNERRISDQGLWMPFAAISKVPNSNDFGFRFKEGNDEVAWDDSHEILTFRYTEPMTWWMSMEGIEKPWTLEKAIAKAEQLADSGDRSALAWRSSAMYDPQGRPVPQILDTPWCNGAVWSINSMPQIDGEVTDYVQKFGKEVIESLYGESDPDTDVGLDGEYIDSSEGYVTRELDCRRDHFTQTTTPLAFEQLTKQPAIFRGLVTYEYTKALAKEVHRRGKYLMANSTPDRLWWLAPQLDVLGTETNWNWGEPTGPQGSWRPMSIREMMYRRTLSGTNAYCFLQNTDFSKFTNEMVDRYMARSVAFGFFPGFFSADASTGHYFTRPDLYERDRALFQKYLPILKTITNAGWEPIPYLQVINQGAVESENIEEKLVVERFGGSSSGSEIYYTIYNPRAEKMDAVLQFSDGYVPKTIDVLIGSDRVIWNTSSPEKMDVDLPAESLIVLKTNVKQP